MNKDLLRRLGVVVILAALAAVFGWIMVVSGLKDRPWVDAYKLTIHLGLGVSLFIFLFITWLRHHGHLKIQVNRKIHPTLRMIIVLAIIQFAFGGFLSGMRAAIAFPTWPLMNGSYVPDVLTDVRNWTLDNFLFYEKSGFMPALVQFVHRNLAYLLLALVILFSLRLSRSIRAEWKWIPGALIGIIVVQALLGIMTLLNSKGAIPLSYGVLHQGGGILFLTFLFYLNELIKPPQIV